MRYETRSIFSIDRLCPTKIRTVNHKIFDSSVVNSSACFPPGAIISGGHGQENIHNIWKAGSGSGSREKKPADLKATMKSRRPRMLGSEGSVSKAIPISLIVYYDDHGNKAGASSDFHSPWALSRSDSMAISSSDVKAIFLLAILLSRCPCST